MPNFDAGSYFLTTLAPIRRGADETGVSHRQRIAETLATLPTALQSPATERIGVISPFARSLRTHLCRFVVIDDAVYNGRPGRNPILTSLFGPEPIIAEEPDRLTNAFLLFVAEIDATTEDGAPLPDTLSEAEQDAVRDAYARSLWERMEPELRAIYPHCVGFDRVKDADGFARYLARCQVETTMPFHDYWTAPPALSALPIVPIAAVAVVPFLVLLSALVGLWFDAATTPLVSHVADWRPGPTAFWAALATVAAVYGIYRFAMARGQKPFPPPKGAHLTGVLKSLYVQQRFADFAVARQGAEPAALHEAFGAFLAEHRPDDESGPTQKPGVVRTPAAGA